jgi:hypothetical protein
LHGSDSKALIPDGIKKSNTKKTCPPFRHLLERVDNCMYGAKPNPYASPRKTGGNGILGHSGPSSSYFLDTPEKKRSPVFEVIPSDSLASPKVPLIYPLCQLRIKTYGNYYELYPTKRHKNPMIISIMSMTHSR